ncbi:MAG: hypothetical protein M5U22_06360 [Thermoleophilia bacterium]|nr:hypothetical protein [Thermoleophilia bacterium]
MSTFDKPLKTYRDKRDFTRTTEPAGGERTPSPEEPLYCIQKHAASSLHYDLRLEVDGVLKSWAVPKGPSLDPKERRLAVMTEDHPLEYGDFEGGIPEGEYGAGTVLLWDTGWWEIDREWIGSTSKKGEESDLLDPVSALGKGELKFVLHGRKLQGSWVLVQMKGRGTKNWLLIKHTDEAARPGFEIEDEEPLSVSTGRTIEEVAADVAGGTPPGGPGDG